MPMRGKVQEKGLLSEALHWTEELSQLCLEDQAKIKKEMLAAAAAAVVVVAAAEVQWMPLAWEQQVQMMVLVLVLGLEPEPEPEPGRTRMNFRKDSGKEQVLLALLLTEKLEGLGEPLEFAAVVVLKVHLLQAQISAC